MNGRTILVADDESQVLHLVSSKLRSAGFEVLTACNGREAHGLAVRRRPDLLITDYQMPQMSGLELCRRLRSDPSTSTIPAIMLTAPGYELAGHDTRRSGIMRMLAKPFTPRTLLAMVGQVLSQ